MSDSKRRVFDLFKKIEGFVEKNGLLIIVHISDDSENERKASLRYGRFEFDGRQFRKGIYHRKFDRFRKKWNWLRQSSNYLSFHGIVEPDFHDPNLGISDVTIQIKGLENHKLTLKDFEEKFLENSEYRIERKELIRKAREF